ncbi:nuclear transport factor 2 family protein [Coleofasciculus sp. FACHB-64]|uniref:nuclear transport factor 2 family protein n=1 Tax=Cyanophyceae TaxID=3028117 RepID=UPI0016889E7A|nr:nuclear transport factor 2 family protein [Coleofasciculus sp. FACHB-64]MBD2048116.1 nuclear transport factor 2 family protein [Coleofasciculus sp. FACHB-64]
MKPEDIRIAITQARDAWIARDAEALTALFAPDGEIILPGQRWQGQERIRQEVTHFAHQYSDVRIEIRQVVVESDRAVVEWYYEDTENATGHRNKADDVIVINFKEGQISRWREYFDTETPKLRTR